ncbi:MarC family integral membrane domain protein, partial [Staphylococcus hominis VCU122]
NDDRDDFRHGVAVFNHGSARQLADFHVGTQTSGTASTPGGGDPRIADRPVVNADIPVRRRENSGVPQPANRNRVHFRRDYFVSDRHQNDFPYAGGQQQRAFRRGKNPSWSRSPSPLVAGPSILAALMLLSHQYPNQISHLVVALLIAWGISAAILLMSDLFLRLLGSKGVSALERLMGLILVMLSTQMFLDGVRAYMKL